MSYQIELSIRNPGRKSITKPQYVDLRTQLVALLVPIDATLGESLYLNAGATVEYHFSLLVWSQTVILQLVRDLFTGTRFHAHLSAKGAGEERPFFVVRLTDMLRWERHRAAPANAAEGEEARP